MQVRKVDNENGIRDILLEKYFSEKKDWRIVIGGPGNRQDRLMAAILLREFGDRIGIAVTAIEWNKRPPAVNWRQGLSEGIVPIGFFKDGPFGRDHGRDSSLTQKMIEFLFWGKKEIRLFEPLGRQMGEFLLSPNHSFGQIESELLVEYIDRAKVTKEEEIAVMTTVIKGWYQRQLEFFNVGADIEKALLKKVKIDGRIAKICIVPEAESKRTASRVLTAKTSLGRIDVFVNQLEQGGTIAILAKPWIDLSEIVKILRIKTQPKMGMQELRELEEKPIGNVLGWFYRKTGNGEEQIIFNSRFSDEKNYKIPDLDEVAEVIKANLRIKKNK